MVQPKISIITVVYNAVGLIESTIKSVANQTYTNIEYIVIDGGSSDGTVEIAERYQHTIALLQSGKDNGIYDAMNKGLRQATGDYVLFLNAGDLLYADHTIEQIFASQPLADVYYGNTAVIDKSGKVIGDRRLQSPAQLTWKSLQYGMCVSHQSFIALKSLCTDYDLQYQVSADIDWVIKILKQAINVENTNVYISKFLEGGTSNTRRKKALLERFQIMTKHYGFWQTIFNHVYILFRYAKHKRMGQNMT
jgi:glycosyltransferase involved in cell wall biosynthesis